MANQSAARACLTMDGLAMASLPALALQSTTWYRGAAVGVLVNGTNAGYATNTFDGSVQVVFAGVLKRNITVPASTDVMFAVKRQLPLKRDGAVLFNAVTTVGNAATPDATWLYKRVYFVSDNEVSLTPQGLFPVYAGLVIGINGMTGTGQIGTTEVLVAIQDAAMAEPIDFSYAATAASSAITASSTETAFSTNVTIPANVLRVGDLLRITFQGICTATNSTDTFTHKLYIGGITGTALLTGTATDVANDNIFAGWALVTIRTIGASGTFVSVGAHTDVPAAAGTAAMDITEIVASTAIDTTAAQQVVVSGKWSTTNAGNSARLDIMTVERIARARVF